MTPVALRAALDSLSLTIAGAARRWRINRRTIERWLSGEVPIPGWAQTIVELELDRVGGKARITPPV